MATVSSSRPRVDIVKDFIRKIRAALDAKQMNVKQLAEKSGVSREYVHRILSEEQSPSLVIAEKIARAVGLEVQTVEAPAPSKTARKTAKAG